MNSNVSFQLGRCITRIAAMLAIVSFLSVSVKIVDIMLFCHFEFFGFRSLFSAGAA